MGEAGTDRGYLLEGPQAVFPDQKPIDSALLLSAPPHLAPSRVMQAIKGKMSHHLLQDHRRLRSTITRGNIYRSGQVPAWRVRVRHLER